MNLIDQSREYLVGNMTFPFTSYLYNRRKIHPKFRELLETDRKPPELLREMQLSRLKSLLDYANRHIPFYTKRFRDIGMEPEEIKTLEDLRGIPPLTRQEVIDFHKDMVDSRLAESIPYADTAKRDPGVPIPFARFRKHKLVRNTSSGSTGAPTVFYEDGSRTSMNWVHEMRLKEWYGVGPGAREARMVRISTDYMPKSRVVRFRKMFWGQLLLPGVNLSDGEYDYCLEAIKEFRPRVMWGFTSALAGLSEYVVRRAKDMGSYRPTVMVGWAAPVYDHERAIMEKAFSCSVSNIYGAREVGHVAGLCPNGSFHINQENLLVETDAPGLDLPSDSPGEILVTTLDLSPMPFIRYRMGDVGEVAPSRCDCGRTLQVIENLLGRTGEIFISKEGRMISPNFWCRTFMSGKISGAVRRFQVIYTKDKNLRIKIEKDAGFSDIAKSHIVEMVKTNFSEKTSLEINYVDRIEPQVSGKYQMVVNEALKA